MRLPVASLLLAVSLAASAAPVARRAPPSVIADSPFRGVWAGSLQAKSAAGTYLYPLLLNLDAASSRAIGVALLPDDLLGNPSAFEFRSLTGTVRGSKISAVVAPSGGAEPLRLDLRLGKGALSGKARGAGLKPGKVLLLPVSASVPLQQVWAEPLGSAAPNGSLVLAISQAQGLTGIGVRGAEFGPLAGASLSGSRFTATLRLPSGDLALDLVLDDGALSGTVGATKRASVVLFPGGVPAPPSVTTFTPGALPVGSETEVAVRGRNLAPGFLLRLDHAGATSSPPVVLDATRATVRIALDASVPVGTLLPVVAVGTDGAPRDAGTLRADAPRAASFSGDLLPVFAASCALSGCHVTPPPDPEYGNGQAPADLVLEAASAYGNLVSRPSTERPDLMRVAPGNPDASYLIMKLRGSAGIEGDRMPFGGPYLTDALIDRFASWIRDGATRN